MRPPAPSLYRDLLAALGSATDLVPIQLVERIDDASRPAGASRKHDTCQLHAMALGLVGQTIEPAEGYKKNATASADARAAAVACG